MIYDILICPFHAPVSKRRVLEFRLLQNSNLRNSVLKVKVAGQRPQFLENQASLYLCPHVGWNGGIIFYNRNFLSPPNVRVRSTDRLQPLWLRRSDISVIFINFVQHLGRPPLKFGGRKPPISVNFPFCRCIATKTLKGVFVKDKKPFLTFETT